MKILSINPGSTAVKYSLFQGDKELKSEVFSRKDSDFSLEEADFIDELDWDFAAMRVVHALDANKPAFFSENIYEKIKEASLYAPIHNRVALRIIDYIKSYRKEKLIFFFDTYFHRRMPKEASSYAIDAKIAEKYKIRKYGFHGLALQSALSELEKKISYLPENIIAVHAGGGVSVSAIKSGISLENSMGLTPTGGIMMLTRSGDVDPELGRILEAKEGFLSAEYSEFLNNSCGFFGLSGSKDTKEIIERAKEGKEPYAFAYSLFLYQLKKAVFAYFGVLGSVDCVMLSGGLAYNNEFFAEDLYKEIKHLPIRRDQIIKVKTDENAFMAQEALRILSGTSKAY